MTAYPQTGLVLKRIHRGSRYGDYVEVIDEDPELAFYGGSVAEGICPDLHDEDDLVEDGSHDRRPRRLTLGPDGWLHCEDGCSPWRFENVG